MLNDLLHGGYHRVEGSQSPRDNFVVQPSTGMVKPRCTVQGCSNGRTKNRFGMCNSHWYEARAEKCVVDDCAKYARSNGLCSIHYTRNRSTGNPLAAVRRREIAVEHRADGRCAHEDCSNKSQQRGLCRRHAEENRGLICVVKDCKRTQHIIREGLCKLHSERKRVNGEVGVSGKIKMPDGTVRPFKKGKYLAIAVRGVGRMQHRMIMEEYIGRPLNSWETVHHINGVTTDNRIENLELWVRRQPSGQRASDLVNWARSVENLFEMSEFVRDDLYLDDISRLSIPAGYLPSAKYLRMHPEFEEGILALASGDNPYSLSQRIGNPQSNKGYLYVPVSGKITPVHRIVMGTRIGRVLTREENVHHLNAIRDDNRIENLELWNTTQPSGLRAIDRAKHILKLYDTEDTMHREGTQR